MMPAIASALGGTPALGNRYGAVSQGQRRTAPKRRWRMPTASAFAAMTIAPAFAHGGNLPWLWPAMAAALAVFCAARTARAAASKKSLPVRIPAPFSYLIWPVLAFAALQAALAYLGIGWDAPRDHLLGLARLAALVLAFGLARHLASDRAARQRCLTALFLCIGFTAALFLAVTLAAPTNSLPLTGPFGGPNGFAAWLGTGLCLAPVAQFVRPTALGRALHICVTIAILADLLMTGARMAPLATLIALTIAFPRWTTRGFVPLVLLSAIGLAAADAGPIARIAPLAADWATRAEHYRAVATTIAARPLLGWGLDSFAPALAASRTGPENATVIWDHAHSIYLSLWVELGVLIGSLPLVAGALAMLRLARSKGNATAKAALAVLISASLQGLFDFSFQLFANAMLLFTILAIGLAAATDRRSQTTPEPRTP